MPSRRFIAHSVLLEALLIGCVSCCAQSCNRPPNDPPAVTINKQPVNFARRTFDPAQPPSDMPPLTEGEYAACDSNFLSNATVAGQTRQTDATHAMLTVTHIKMDLQLNLTTGYPMAQMTMSRNTKKAIAKSPNIIISSPTNYQTESP